MGTHDAPPPIIEPVPVPTSFITDVVFEEIGGGNFRIIGLQRILSPVEEYRLEMRAIMNKEAILAAMYAAAKAIGWHLAGELESVSGRKSTSKH